MKWKEIKEKYPKAYKKACEWGFAEGWDTEKEEGLMTFEYGCGLRNLFNFFDDNEIFISIELEVQYTREIDADDRNPTYMPEGFYYSIHSNSYYLGGGGVLKTRQETEIAAFTKAFDRLEKKL